MSVMATTPTCPPHKRGLETENEVEGKRRKGSGGRGGNGKRRRYASCLTDRYSEPSPMLLVRHISDVAPTGAYSFLIVKIGTRSATVGEVRDALT
jgi:hypothetical protein